MKKFAGVLFLFILFFIIGLGVVQIFPDRQDKKLKSEIKINSAEPDIKLPSTFSYFMKKPGKYDEISINIKLKSSEHLTVTVNDLKAVGMEFKPDGNHLKLTDVKILNDNAKLYIPAGTVISQSGYKLEKDYILMELQIIESYGEFWGIFFRKFYYIIIISAVLALLTLIPWRSVFELDGDLDFNYGVARMAVIIPCLIFGGGVFVMMSGQIGHGTYQNDIMCLAFISMIVIPLGIIAVYSVISTLIHNIKAAGFFAGSFIIIVQLILVCTVIYAAGAAFFTLFAGSDSIMEKAR